MAGPDPSDQAQRGVLPSNAQVTDVASTIPHCRNVVPR